MIISELVETLELQDVELWEENGSIRYRGAEDVMTDEIRTALGDSKQDVLTFLRNRVIDLPVVKHNATELYDQFPVTDLQGAYIIGSDNTYDFGNTGCHSYFELEFKNLDTEKLSAAWQKLIVRHPMLRCTFSKIGTQKILDKIPIYNIKENNLNGADEKKETSQINSTRDEMSHQGFDIEKWPLFDLRTTITETKAIFHISIDLLISDYMSIQILLNELGILYSKPDTQFSEFEITFRDYVIAEKKIVNFKGYKESRQYWLNRLDKFPQAPDLPLKRSYSEIQKPYFTRKHKKLENEIWNAFKKMAANFDLTPSTAILAAYGEIISRWSSQSHFSINMTVLNRLPLHQDVINLVGDFTSVNLLEIKNETGIKFFEKARKIQNRLWQDMDHRYFSGIEVIREIVRKKGRENSIMPVVFTSMIGVGDLEKQKLNLMNQGNIVYGISQTPQVWLDCQVMEKDQGLEINWDYIESLFPENLIDDMFQSFTELLYELAKNKKNWEKISLVKLSEKQNLKRIEVNNTSEELPEIMLHTMFEKNVLKNPSNKAVTTSVKNLTYLELSDYSKIIAKRLVDTGALPNTLVAIVMDKGWEQIAGVTGVLKSGAAYLPVSSDTPEERLYNILFDGDVKIVLTQSWLGDKINWPDDIELISVDRIDPFNIPSEIIEVPQNPENLAYVIYTSGSTGKPKGVMIDHRGAVNTILDINRKFSVNAEDKVLALAAINFDLSVYDIFGTLAAGGTIVIPEPKGINDPAYWLDLIKSERITIWNSVPQLMQMLTEYTAENEDELSESVRLVLMSGDWIPLDLPSQIKSVFDNAQVISLGGATEASIWSIFYPIEHVDLSWKSIPYGRPMSNQTIYVLNGNMDNCPDWATGNLYIGGIGLAQGYWNDRQKSEATFVNHPETGERLYRTGDLGRYLPDGNIEFLGREDFQIKINGYRVEMGEIEAALKQYPGIINSVVHAVNDQYGNKNIVGYIVIEDSTIFFDTDLRNFLKQKIPAYMVPSFYEILEKLPVTPNGKIDRKQLPEPGKIITNPGNEYIAPQNKMERIITNIFQEITGIEKVGINDNFFDLGANSMHLVKIQMRLRTDLDKAISIIDLFEYPTINSLAEFLNLNKKDDSFRNHADKRAEKRNAKRGRRLKLTATDLIRDTLENKASPEPPVHDA